MRSILDRYDRFDDLDARADKLAAENKAGPVHIACTEVLTEMITMASTLSGAEHVPAPMRAALATLNRLRPMMLEGLIDVPEDKIREFMAGMIDKLQTIIDAAGGEHDVAAGGTGTDRATA